MAVSPLSYGSFLLHTLLPQKNVLKVRQAHFVATAAKQYGDPDKVAWQCIAVQLQQEVAWQCTTVQLQQEVSYHRHMPHHPITAAWSMQLVPSAHHLVPSAH